MSRDLHEAERRAAAAAAREREDRKRERYQVEPQLKLQSEAEVRYDLAYHRGLAAAWSLVHAFIDGGKDVDELKLTALASEQGATRFVGLARDELQDRGLLG